MPIRLASEMGGMGWDRRYNPFQLGNPPLPLFFFWGGGPAGAVVVNPSVSKTKSDSSSDDKNKTNVRKWETYTLACRRHQTMLPVLNRHLRLHPVAVCVCVCVRHGCGCLGFRPCARRNRWLPHPVHVIAIDGVQFWFGPPLLGRLRVSALHRVVFPHRIG